MAAYLKWVAAGFLGIYALVGATNWLIDPFGIHASPRIDGVNALKPAILKRGRIFKTIVSTRGDWDVLILGTSRADVGLDPEHPAFAGRKCFNAATANQPHEETFKLFDAASRSGHLSHAVVALDFFASNPRYGEMPDYEPANYRWWRPLQVAFSGDTLMEAIRTVQRQDVALVMRDYGHWHANGRREFAIRSGHRAAALGSDEAYVRSHHLYPYRFSHEGSEPLAHIRHLFALAHARRIHLQLLISPSHARQWETLAVDGLWPAWEEWKRRLVLMNQEEADKAGQKPFPLWDFSGYHDITTEPFPPAKDLTATMKWYWESSHYKKEVGDLVLDRVFSLPAQRHPTASSFGILLTGDNLERHLAAIRGGRAAWVRAYPEDAAEIKRVAAEYAKKYPSRNRPD